MAVFYADPSNHAPSAKAFLAADGFCALRTLGEVYGGLTRLPLRPRITGTNALAIVKQIRDRLSLIPLDEQEYISAIEFAASGGIIGAAFYDLLIARCAVKAKADILLTWNVRDFVRFGSHVQQIIKSRLNYKAGFEPPQPALHTKVLR
jgi:predicted nucleic acid-binding protein